MAYISKINQEKNEWSKIDSDLIAVGIFEEKTLTDLANQIDMENDKILTNAIKTGDLKGKVGEQNLIYVNQTRVLVVGLGKKKIKPRYYTKSFRFSIEIRYKAKDFICVN